MGPAGAGDGDVRRPGEPGPGAAQAGSPRLWSTREAARIAGITFAQVDRWTHLGILEPAAAVDKRGRETARTLNAPGSGYSRRWDRLEVLVMAVTGRACALGGQGIVRHGEAIAAQVRARNDRVVLDDSSDQYTPAMTWLTIDVAAVERSLKW